MPPRAARKRKALQEVQNASVNGLGTSQDLSQFEYLDAIQDMIDNIDRAGTWSSACSRVSRPRRRPTCRNSVVVSHSTISPCAVEEKIHEINQATKNAVASLNTTLKTRLVRLPKALKMAPLDDVVGRCAGQGRGCATGPGRASFAAWRRRGQRRTRAGSCTERPGGNWGGRGRERSEAREETWSTRSTRSPRGTDGGQALVSLRPHATRQPRPGRPARVTPQRAAQAPTAPLPAEANPAPSPPPVQFSQGQEARRATSTPRRTPFHRCRTTACRCRLQCPFQARPCPCLSSC